MLRIIEDMEKALCCLPLDACQSTPSGQASSKQTVAQSNARCMSSKSRNNSGHSESLNKDRTRTLHQEQDDELQNSSQNLVGRLLSTVSRITKITGIPEVFYVAASVRLILPSNFEEIRSCLSVLILSLILNFWYLQSTEEIVSIQKGQQSRSKSSVQNYNTETLQAQLENGCKQLEETCRQMEETCDTLRQQKNQLMEWVWIEWKSYCLTFYKF